MLVKDIIWEGRVDIIRGDDKIKDIFLRETVDVRDGGDVIEDKGTWSETDIDGVKFKDMFPWGIVDVKNDRDLVEDIFPGTIVDAEGNEIPSKDIFVRVIAEFRDGWVVIDVILPFSKVDDVVLVEDIFPGLIVDGKVVFPGIVADVEDGGDELEDINPWGVVDDKDDCVVETFIVLEGIKAIDDPFAVEEEELLLERFDTEGAEDILDNIWGEGTPLWDTLAECVNVSVTALLTFDWTCKVWLGRNSRSILFAELKSIFTIRVMQM